MQNKKICTKLRKVKLTVSGDDEEIEGYIPRDWNENRTRYNTWNGWEIPFLTIEQVKAWIPNQAEMQSNDPQTDEWELIFNEETGEEELWVYDWQNEFYSKTLEEFLEEDRDYEMKPGIDYLETKHGIFSSDIVHTLHEAETFDGEIIKVFATPCYTWELASEEL